MKNCKHCKKPFKPWSDNDYFCGYWCEDKHKKWKNISKTTSSISDT